MTCPTCSRTLLSSPAWQSLTLAQRKRLGRTHAREKARGLCDRCYCRNGRVNVVAYPGEWSTGSLVRRGSLARCAE